MKNMFAVLALTGLLCSPAAAVTIYNNLGPGNSFDPSGWYSAQNAALATPFVATGTAALTDVVLPVGVFGNQNLTLELRTENAGQPGSLVESWAATVPLGIPLDASDLVTLLSAVNPVLTAGTQYWFVAIAGGETTVRWNTNDQGLTGGNYYSDAGQFVQNGAFALSYAIQLNGTVDEVPEPGTIVTFLAGAVLVFGLRKSR